MLGCGCNVDVTSCNRLICSNPNTNTGHKRSSFAEGIESMAMAAAAQALVCAASSCSSSRSHNGVISPSSSRTARGEERTSMSSRSDFLGAKNGCVISLPRRSKTTGCESMAVEAALSREKKATVEKARQQLEGAQLVAGIKYSGLTVTLLQTLRKSLPETQTLIEKAGMTKNLHFLEEVARVFDDEVVVIQQQERQIGRRQALATMLVLCSVPIVLTQMPGNLLAAEEAKKEAENNDQSVLGGLLSLFDPNETTKQGKKLPKAYLKSARDVVQTLRASFSEDSQNDAKFRRNADSAKGAIREYISNWRGTKLVDAEDSYEALERVLRGLSEFYSKKGPSAVLPEDVRARILEDLQKADDAL